MVPSQAEYDPNTHLSLADIALDNKVNPSVTQVTIKQSKTDPFRQGVDLYLGRTGKDIICPIQAIVPYLIKRGTQPGPLFVFAYGSHDSDLHHWSLPLHSMLDLTSAANVLLILIK